MSRTNARGRDHRRRARPRSGAARGRHGPVGDPLRGSRGAARSARLRGPRPRECRDRGPRGDGACATSARASCRRSRTTCERIAAKIVEEVPAPERIPLVLGGDHSVALGTLGGLASVHGRGGVLWIDAHAGHQHAGDEPERERPRHAARGGAGTRRPGVRERRLAASGCRSKRVALIGLRAG